MHLLDQPKTSSCNQAINVTIPTLRQTLKKSAKLKHGHSP